MKDRRCILRVPEFTESSDPQLPTRWPGVRMVTLFGCKQCFTDFTRYGYAFNITFDSVIKKSHDKLNTNSAPAFDYSGDKDNIGFIVPNYFA